MNRGKTVLALAVVAMAAIAFTATSANAAVVPLAGQLGILDVTGTNPATGVAWALGDQYRLVFITSGNTTGASTDITAYNAFVQAAADASTLGLSGATWKVVGSTADVAARDNTSTNPNEDGAGVPIFLMDGITLVAIDNTDLWNGIGAAIGLDENAAARFSDRVLTGSNGNGTPNDRVLGGSTEVPPKVMTGRTDRTGNGWMVDFNEPATAARPVFAMSDPLTVVPEPATMGLLAIGGLALLRRRRRA